MNIIARVLPPAPMPISNDPNRYQGDGVLFRGKLIGIMDVPELKGDKMCFDAMQKLKSDVITRGEHKSRIFVGVGFEGIKIRKNENERLGDMWHHHEVKCISFIWRDPTDGRAFGYVTALSADTKKQFVAIKTERAADQVITTLKDLFQVIIEMKQKDNIRDQTRTPTPAPAPAPAPAPVTDDLQETVVAPKVAVAVAAAPRPEPQVEESNLFDLGPEEPPKKEENFFDMLLAPPSTETQSAAPNNFDILGGALSGGGAPAAWGAAPAAVPPAWGAAPAAVPSAWGAAPAAAPFNQQMFGAQAAAPMGFTGGAANPFFTSPAAPFVQPPMAAPAFAGLNVGPGFTSAPPAAAYNQYGGAAFVPQMQMQGRQSVPTMSSYGTPAMAPAPVWGTPQPAAAPKVANPFTNERGNAAPTQQQSNPVNPFGVPVKKDTPFFSDLVVAGKEMYGVWPETNKQTERPKALHELISSRQAQPVQPTQPTHSPFGADLFPSTAISSSGNLLD